MNTFIEDLNELKERLETKIKNFNEPLTIINETIERYNNIPSHVDCFECERREIQQEFYELRLNSNYEF